MSTGRDIVCIGASAGGLQALVGLVGERPGDLSAAVFVVVHTSPDNPEVPAELLGNAGHLPAEPATHGLRAAAARRPRLEN